MDGTVDIALMIEKVAGEGAEYGGSVTANTREAFEAIRWEDQREKPTWKQLEDAWTAYVEPPEPLPLEERLTALEAEVMELKRLKPTP